MSWKAAKFSSSQKYYDVKDKKRCPRFEFSRPDLLAYFQLLSVPLYFSVTIIISGVLVVYREVHPLEWKARMPEFLCKPG